MQATNRTNKNDSFAWSIYYLEFYSILPLSLQTDDKFPSTNYKKKNIN